jgi:hypothetical protein
MIRTPKDDWDTWVSKAIVAEEHAKRLDREAHSFPINVDLFLKAAKYSRESAKYQQLASQSTDDSFKKSTALTNYFIMKANVYKSLGNFFYYSLKQLRAAGFFERAARQHALSASHLPLDIDDYSMHVQDCIEHKTELQALVANCKGAIALDSENWTEALEHFTLEKKLWKNLKSLGGKYAQSLHIGAAIKSAEREIQVCKTMICFENSDFVRASKHAESALVAAEKTLQEYPDWIYFQKALTRTVTLKEKLANIMNLSSALGDLASKFETIFEKTQSFLDNLVSDKFVKEVESYLRREYQYHNTRCKYKPRYLGREIDVYASKGEEKTTITICECKLRLGNQPINVDEIERFSKLSRAVRQYEERKANQEGRRVTVIAWFVTNTNSVEDKAIAIAKENNVKIMQASIPKDCKSLCSDANWSVSRLRRLG